MQLVRVCTIYGGLLYAQLEVNLNDFQSSVTVSLSSEFNQVEHQSMKLLSPIWKIKQAQN